MGNFQSIEKRVQGSTATVEADYNAVMRYGNQLVIDAISNGWLPGDTEALCNRIVFSERDLFNWVDVQSLFHINARLGLAPVTTPTRNQTIHREACSYISRYFQDKVRVAAYILQNLEALCFDMREVIAQNMPVMLVGASSSDQRQSLSRLQNLDKILDNMYTRLSRILGELVGNITDKRTLQLAADAQNVLTTGFSGCCAAVNDLRDFTWEREAAPGGGVQYVNHYLSGDPVLSDLPLIAERGLTSKTQAKPASCARRINLADAVLTRQQFAFAGAPAR